MLASTYYAALKAAINAETDAACIAFRADPTHPDKADAVAAYYNETTADDGWRSAFTAQLSSAAVVTGASEVDNLEVGKRDTLFWLIERTLDARDAGVRAAFSDLTANRTGGFVATALRNALSAAAKRKLLRIEKLLATGPTGGALVTTHEGTITYDDVRKAYAQG